MYIEPRLPDHTDIWTANLKSRIVHCFGEIEENMAESIIAQLLYLDSQNNEEIQLYINSYGGEITAGMAIYDTMQHIKSPVRTICVGKAMSMGAVLLSAGEKGRRCILPHATVMIHQALGGAKGQSSDVEIEALELKYNKDMLNKLLAKNCGKKIDEVVKDTDRNTYLHGEDAVKYGIVDKVLSVNKD
ncbi:MAG: ATP-dependent Clp protease proteolytic subunit [Treponema sp.]|uniref:ATP-dependent Clp protease proteolytic subunit n=1 Tax=Treponema sp. TaxID=166 RepID=UPI00298EB278|nr:ATP-dependent Clp protease proteolytic subunit [Treponema sp.]MCQ2601257.1 ATP-dependent Clp protease proteolytic subunit [Treponema sp.]